MATARGYIDGFSLYYGRLKGSANKWLDLCQLIEFLLRNDEIVEVRYYTALDPDADAQDRQRAYWRALRAADSRITITRVDPFNPVQKLGSDLLTRAAAVDGDEVSVVVSDDARLAEPLARCWPQFHHSWGIATPSGRFNAALVASAGFRKRVRPSMLISLPEDLEDEHGPITKPAQW